MSIDRIARVVNFPRHAMPDAVTTAVDRINKRNLVVNLWEILQEEKEKQPKNTKGTRKTTKTYDRRRGTVVGLEPDKRSSMKFAGLRRDSKVSFSRTTSLL